MINEPLRLRLVELLEPKLCHTCRFVSWGLVEEDGKQSRTLRCQRLDCDNWVTKGPDRLVTVVDDS